MPLLYVGYKVLLALVAASVGMAVAWHRRTIHKGARALADDLEALAGVSPGGRPESAISVPSTVVVEIRATALPSHVRGEVSTKVQQHTTRELRGERLREVLVRCTACSAEREAFLRLAPPSASS